VAREIDQGELVLFPVRLDEAIMETNVSWAREIKQDRHIGDFTRWKEHDAYQKAFQRLLRDLSPETMPALPAHIQAQADEREARARAQQVESLRRQLTRHQGNLNKLKEQVAVYGVGEQPLHLLNQIEAEESRVLELERQLKDFS
jgi:hypothetical protein